MANSLATALYYKGADVCLVSTKVVDIPNEIHTIKIQSSNDMFEYVKDSIRVALKGKMSEATLMDSSNQQLIQKKPYFFSVAAVSDFTPTYPQNGKMKKQDIGDTWDLKLKKNIDILDSIEKQNIYTIGFKAEMDKDNATTNATNMLKSKNIDAVCLNILDEENSFGSDTNTIELITSNMHSTSGEVERDVGLVPTLLSGNKLNVSLSLLDKLKATFSE